MGIRILKSTVSASSMMTWFCFALYIAKLKFSSNFQNPNYLSVNGKPFTSSLKYQIKQWKNITLFNETDFQFRRNLPNLCSNYPNLNSVIVIHSAPTNFDRRIAIRQTWGRNKTMMPILFLMGTTTNSTVKAANDIEFQMHQDIIQGSFIDTYHNLTYKHVMGLLWTVLYCPTAKLVMKADDDVFVNVANFQKYVNDIFGPNKKEKKVPHVQCHAIPMHERKVPRSRRSSWRVDFQQYPFKMYPLYCAGCVEIFSRYSIVRLLEQVNKNEFLWIDDVYITAILTNSANLQFQNTESGFSIYSLDSTNKESVERFRKAILGPAQLKPSTVYKVWTLLNDGLRNSSITVRIPSRFLGCPNCY